MIYRGGGLSIDIYRVARSGCTVIVPFREEMAKRHLKVTGDLGRVVFMVEILARVWGIVR